MVFAELEDLLGRAQTAAAANGRKRISHTSFQRQHRDKSTASCLSSCKAQEALLWEGASRLSAHLNLSI